MAETLSTLQVEINELKEKFPADCRVINSIGEFACVINVSFLKWSLKLKFQITDDYPAVPADVVTACVNHSDEMFSMSNDLQKYLKEESSQKTLVEIAIIAEKWLQENGVLATSELPLSSQKPRVSKKKSVPVEDSCSPAKQAPMRTAADVINRIQWQKDLKPEDFVVGYLDRFEGIQEKNFSTFSWNDIAAVDDYTEFTIPQHLIQYFKYCGTTVWDKESRLDNIFGSTGSGITLQNLTSATQAATTVDVNISGHGFDVTDVKKGSLVPANVPKNSSHSARSRGRPRPNYFLCVRILADSIIKGIEKVQMDIAASAPSFSTSFIQPSTLHVTLCTLCIKHNRQLDIVCDILRRAKSELSAMAQRGVSFHVRGVDDFYERVVIARIRPSSQLTEFANFLRHLLQEYLSDCYDFQPHVTILKLTRDNERVVGSSRVPRQLYSMSADRDFGEQIVSSIDLCAMSYSVARTPGEFYATPMHIDLL